MHILEFAAEPLGHARVPAPTMRHGAALLHGSNW
jgi:hypothetical protein